MITRRSVAQLLGIVPVLPKLQAVQRLDGLEGMMGVPAMGGTSLPTAGVDSGQKLVAKMPSWKAAKILMNDPTVAAAVRAHAYKKHRIVHQIDPDLAILRSCSMMAKVTFQRQRDVEKAIEYEMSDQRWEIFAVVWDKIEKLTGMKSDG